MWYDIRWWEENHIGSIHTFKVYQFQSPKYIGRDRVFLIEDENDTQIIHPQVDNNQIIINSLKNNTSDTISIKSNLFGNNIIISIKIRYF